LIPDWTYFHCPGATQLSVAFLQDEVGVEHQEFHLIDAATVVLVGRLEHGISVNIAPPESRQ